MFFIDYQNLQNNYKNYQYYSKRKTLFVRKISDDSLAIASDGSMVPNHSGRRMSNLTFVN
jgi:hypothetical protein